MNELHYARYKTNGTLPNGNMPFVFRLAVWPLRLTADA
jgi:hypothetical protein